MKIVLDDSPDEKWNERLLVSKFATEFQTKEYATYVNKELKWKPVFIRFISKDNDIVGQLLAFHIPMNFRKKITFTKKKLRWKFGPIIFNEEFKLEIIQEFKKFLLQTKYILDCNEHPLNYGLLNSFNDVFPLTKWATFLIDLTLDINVLWKNTDKNSVRKNVKRSESRGVYVKQMSVDDLEVYKTIREDDINQKSPPSSSRLYFRWKTLHPIGFTGFLAFKNEIPLGGILLSTFNGYVVESGIARTKLDFQENFYAQDLLKWNIIKWGIKQNYSYYDLAGVNPIPRTKKDEGIFRYKKKWGGNLYSYNIIRN